LYPLCLTTLQLLDFWQHPLTYMVSNLSNENGLFTHNTNFVLNGTNVVSYNRICQIEAFLNMLYDRILCRMTQNLC
jgi:hypothetical protein